MPGNGFDVTAAVAAIQAGADAGVRDAGEHLLQVSQGLAPIEEGTLIRSGKVTTRGTGDEITATVSYDTPYAVRQHEETGYRHDAGRQAKYLEDPMRTEKDTLARIVAQAVKARL